jgi:hypothetical protein
VNPASPDTPVIRTPDQRLRVFVSSALAELAFAHRHSRLMINVAAVYDPSTSERSEHAAWVSRPSDELDDGDPGAYVGFLADEGEERVRRRTPARRGNGRP